MTHRLDPIRPAPGALRRARPDDRQELIALHRLALRTLTRDHYSPVQIDSLLGHMPTLDPLLIDDGTYYVIECEGGIVACGGWSCRAPGYDAALRADAAGHRGDARRALIRAMYTHPAWSRRGLGRRILTTSEAHARRARVQAIELDALLPGVPLYRGAGYRPREERVLAFPDGRSLPVLHMSKPVSPTAALDPADALALE